MFIVIAILIFGALIAIHEFGHFIAAKKLGVKVNEFAIGMGPKILSKQRGETLYAWRLFPIGGACVMEGEDENTPDPRAFTAKPRWKRAIILVMGAAFNFAAGFIIVLVLALCLKSGQVGAPTLAGVYEGSAYTDVLQSGDKIYSVDRHRVYYERDFAMFVNLAEMRKDDTIDLVIVRNGEKVQLPNFALEKREFQLVNGNTAMLYGIAFNDMQMNFGQKLNYALYDTYNNVRQVWLGLEMLITGGAKMSDLSGPVGIVSIISEAGSYSEPNADGVLVKVPLSERVKYVMSIAALIAINLAVVNLLPIPALDGGRVFALIVTFFLEKILRRKVNPKYEGYVHAAGLVLLLGLTAVIMVSDIVKVVHH
ncbi:MAG: M50 family metallopeptidase [Oscillospiraceae bacterium]|jgi:regulator of sigma E protease|nr:M50 family metallopeptidase [Oscillospiraceae bacterium]